MGTDDDRKLPSQAFIADGAMASVNTTAADNTIGSAPTSTSRSSVGSNSQQEAVSSAGGSTNAAATDFSRNLYQSQGYTTDGRSTTAAEAHDHNNHDHGSQVSWFVVKLTIISALGGFLFGYDTGVVSGAMLLIADEFSLTELQQEIVVSITIVGAVTASLTGGPTMEHFGRKPAILTAAVIFTLGAVLLAAARTYGELVAGRLIVGLGIGLASLTTPVYIAEAAPSHMRGTLVTLNTLFITCGQVVAGIVDGLFAETPAGWRYMLGLSGLPSLFMMIGFVSLPESPRWLVAVGRRREALSVLQTIRGTMDVHAEVEEMVESSTDRSSLNGDRLRASATVNDLLEDPRIRRALVLGCGLQMLQQLSGINTVMYYSATIFKMAGFTMNAAIWLAALTAASQSVGVCFGLYFIEVCGRRMLVLSSLSMVIVSLFCLGVGFHLSDTQSEGSGYGWLVVLAMVAYLLAFGVGMSSIPWTVNAEIYPTHARSLGTSASTTTNWIGNVVVSATFLSLASDRALGQDGAFWLYAAIGMAGWVWLYGCMPETKGLSLEEIELLFAREGDPVRPGEGDDGGCDGIGVGRGGAQVRSGGFVLLQGNSPDGKDEASEVRTGSGPWSSSGGNANMT